MRGGFDLSNFVCFRISLPKDLRLADYGTGPRASFKHGKMTTPPLRQVKMDFERFLLETGMTSIFRLPPLSGFDEFTLHRLYSRLVADILRIHPKRVAWIGERAIAMIKSLATKDSPFETNLES